MNEIFQKVAEIFQKVADFFQKVNDFYYIWFLSVFLVFSCFSNNQTELGVYTGGLSFEKQIKTRNTDKNQKVGVQAGVPLGFAASLAKKLGCRQKCL